MHEGGTVVVIQGPRFSTMAESRWFSQMGWDVVNMTQYPEAALAKEAGHPLSPAVALVTDYDAGLEGRDDIEPVTMDQVFAVLPLQRRAGPRRAPPGHRHHPPAAGVLTPRAAPASPTRRPW